MISTMAINNLTFRAATTNDAAPLARLINAAFSADTTTQAFLSADHAPITVTDVPDILARIADPACAVLAAADPADSSDAPALVAHCSVRRPDDFGTRGRAWVGLLAVDAGFQGRGFGVQALAWAERHARREWGARRMELDVVASRVDLIAWYERRGYRTTGETRPFPYEQKKDWEGVLRDDLYFVFMGKDLDNVPI
jgi:GNAT superfamily N-acetyltransferase